MNPERLVIKDDKDPAVCHVITASEAGLEHVRRGVEARINYQALQIALNIASRELMAQMEKVELLEAALHQEQKLNENMAAQLDLMEHLMRTVAV